MMATYELTNTPVLPKLVPGDSLTCTFSGEQKMVTLPKGIYKLECWGAQGYPYDEDQEGVGGRGGYSRGNIELKSTTNLYLYVGGAGRDDGEGGFNGGGDGGSNGGGGATDIRVNGTSLYRRVIVAGGGGGGGEYSPFDHKERWDGGVGGDTVGEDGESTYCAGFGGTQTQGGFGGIGNTTSGTDGSFGYGGTGGKGSILAGAGGGGGWYGGGGGGYTTGLPDEAIHGGAAGGGSGYVYNKTNAPNYPTGCMLDSRYYLTKTSMSRGSNSGNGYIKITVIEVARIDTIKVKMNGTIVNLEDAYAKVDGSFKEIDSGYLKINGEWKTLF